MTEQASSRDARSTASLFSEAFTLAAGLVRKEVDLARAEVTENLSKAAVAIGMIVGGVVLVLVALNVLSAALVAGLTELGIEAGWAALIVGAVYFVIAVILVRKGTQELKAANLAPTRAAQNVREDILVLKEKING
jgi:hypothetical protein